MSYKTSKIAILRSAIDKVTQILAGRKISVIQKGMMARVEYDTKTLLPMVVYLPMLPDDASDDLCAAVQGFLDHEVAHVLFSDPKVLVDACKTLSPEGKSINNMIEDVFVERKMGQTFRGSGSNLNQTGEFYLHTFVLPKLLEARAKGDAKAELSIMLPTIMRALGGQRVFKEALSEYGSPATEGIFSLLEDLSPRMSKIESSAEAHSLTQDVLSRLKGDSSSDKTDKSDEKSSKKPKSEPEKSADEQSKASDEKDEDPEESEGDEGTEGDKEDDDSSTAPSEKGESEEEGERHKSDASDDDEGEGDEPCETEPDASKGESGEEDKDGEGEGNASEEGGDEGDGTQSGEVHEKMDNSLDDGEVPEVSSTQTSEDGADLDWDEMASALAEAKDYDESAAEMIAGMALSSAQADDGYLPYSTDFDSVEVLQVDARNKDKMIEGFTRVIEEPVLPMVNSIQKTLERVIAARSAATFVGGHRSGRLHGSSLTRLQFGDDRVFRRKEENKTKDVAVSLVIDFSGSMSGGKIVVAAQAAFALALVLERLRIKSEIIGFTTGRYLLENEDQEFAYKNKIRYSRTENLIMPIIKTMDEAITSDVRARFGSMPRELPMHSNIDGECVEIAAKRLLSRKASRHIMIVLSDGQPAGHTMQSDNVFREDLKRRVQKIEGAGVDVVGVGIMSSAVRQYYPRHVIINNIQELPTTVVGQLRVLLLQQ